jgi:hypothetical protein
VSECDARYMKGKQEGKYLLGQMAGAVGGVQDLVIEHRKVKSQAQADGVRGGQVAGGDLAGGGVGLQSLRSGILAHVAVLELSQVSNCTRYDAVSYERINVRMCGHL